MSSRQRREVRGDLRSGSTLVWRGQSRVGLPSMYPHRSSATSRLIHLFLGAQAPLNPIAELPGRNTIPSAAVQARLRVVRNTEPLFHVPG